MRNSYKDLLMSNSSTLDAMTNSGGEITNLAHEIVTKVDAESTQRFLTILKQLAKEGEDDKRVTLVIKNVHETLVKYFGEMKIREICTDVHVNKEDENAEHDIPLPELLRQLNSLVGLNSVKSKVNDLIAFHKIQQQRKLYRLACTKSTMHMAFVGNPGTGKTTVARIVGRIYKQIGLLSKGHFIEVSRTDLIAGYQGQTAHKVKKVVDKARGGVLFIDEAYSITENDHSDSYGRECLTELTKALEDYRDDLVVIVAGYTEPMKAFFNSNPGLQSRFNTFIEFEDFNSEELLKIFEKLCTDNDYVCNQLVQTKVKSLIEAQLAKAESNFANGRYIRNIFDSAIVNQAKRLYQKSNVEKNELEELLPMDLV